MTAAVTADGLSKRYGDTVALDAVSLSVDAGSIFALVGPNGAGKTTLVRALTGTIEPDSGTVTVLDDSPEQLEKEQIGLLPQSFNPPERLTARELLGYYAGLYDDSREVDAVLSDVGLHETADMWYADLSGGQQRRVCVGIALINDPDLLFLDEPTTGIDPAGRQAVWSLITDLSASGTTVFLTTHYMKEAEELADEVALLDAGSIVEAGPPWNLVEAFGGGTQLRVEMETVPSSAQLNALGKEVTVGETGLRIQNVSPREIGDIVTKLEAEGITYETLTWSEPSLEDVYLQLTGENTTENTQTEAIVQSG